MRGVYDMYGRINFNTILRKLNGFATENDVAE